MLAGAALALERLLVRRRAAAGLLVYADAFERWGPKEGPEVDQMIADAAAAQREHEQITGELTARAQETWASDRESMVAWANAHVDLLERFIAVHAGDEAQSTARFLAQREMDEWRKVARGELAYVDETAAHVDVDAAQYAAYFGAP
jgi:hypothetical protein